MYKIGIISDSIRDQSTGIGYYAREVAKQIKINYPNILYIDYQRNSFNKLNLLLIPLFTRYFKTYSWAHLLPFNIRKTEVEYVINLTGIPHYLKYNQKEVFFVYDISWLLFWWTHPLSRVIFNLLFFRKTVTSCYKIAVISQNTKNDLIKYYHVPEDKIRIIYPNLPKPPSAEKKPSSDISNNYILYVGTIEPRKNINTLIKAYSLLYLANKIQHKLVIAGKNGWKYQSTYKLVHQLGLDSQVIFTGYISNEEKKYLYTHADVFVYPSLYEGFGIPPLEAMYYRCPVITTNVSSMPEVVGNSCKKIDPDDVEGLSSEIYELITNRVYRNDVIVKQSRQCKKFMEVSIPKDLFE
ncbi:MAG: glycosyltransferase family 1 protein [bacterium]